MSLILVDGLKDRPGTGGPKFPNGLHLPAGIGITGDGHINMAGVCTFSGNVTIGGTLTYEDVTNIDSVGVVTARSGVNVSGGEFKVGTAVTVGSAGVSTFFGVVNLNRKTTVNATLEATEGLAVTAGVGTFDCDRVRIVRNAGPILELTTNTNGADSSIHLHEGAAGSTSNGGALVYSGASNRLDICCGTTLTTEKISVLRDSVSVGIGTVTPDQTLELWKASGTNLLKVTSEANSTIGIEIEKTGATTQSWRIADGQTANGKLEIYDVTDSRSVMTFDGAGKVGVGTLSPGMQFHINGVGANDILKLTSNGSGQMVNMQNHSNNPVIVRFANAAGNAFWDAQYNTDNSFSLDHSDSEKFRITSGGTVGINESSPDTNFKLDVDGRIKLTDDLSMADDKMVYWGDSDSSFIKGADVAAGGYLIFGANNEKMRLLSSGYLGIGITNPTANLDCYHASNNTIVNIKSGDAGAYLQAQDNTGAGIFGQNGANTVISCDPADSVSSSAIIFQVDANAERARITSSGEWMVATTSSSPDTASTVSGMTYSSSKLRVARNGDACTAFNRNSTTGDIMQLNYNGTQRGSIQTDGTVIAFNTGSDYRLKENEVALTDGITKVKQLKPYTFNFKDSPNKIDQGFFAHEVQPVVPGAVSGTKDAVHSEDKDSEGIKAGDIDAQQMDYAKLTPLLTAALQEAIAKIETLETKVAALESN